MKQPPGIMIYISEYNSFRPVLSNEQKGILLDALIDYQSGNNVDLKEDPILQAALNILSNKIKRDSDKYAAMCIRNAEIARNRRKPLVSPVVTSRDQSLPVVTNSNSNSNCNCNRNCNSNTIDVSCGDNPPSNESDNRTIQINEKKKVKFIPPSVDEVRSYCQERKNGIDPQQFIDYYERSGWIMSNGQKVKDWKACIRTWEHNDQRGVNNGFSRTHSSDRVPGQRDLYEF